MADYTLSCDIDSLYSTGRCVFINVLYTMYRYMSIGSLIKYMYLSFYGDKMADYTYVCDVRGLQRTRDVTDPLAVTIWTYKRRLDRTGPVLILI